MCVIFDLDDTLHDKSASLNKCGIALYEEYLQCYPKERSKFVFSFIRKNCIIQAKADVFATRAMEFNIPLDLQSALLGRFDRSFHLFSSMQ